MNKTVPSKVGHLFFEKQKTRKQQRKSMNKIHNAPNDGADTPQQVTPATTPNKQPIVEKPVYISKDGRKYFGSAGHQRPDGSLVDESFD